MGRKAGWVLRNDADMRIITIMHKLNQQGSVFSIILIVFSVLAMIGLAGFGGWAYVTRQDYKDNSDAKVTVAVAKTVEQEKAKKAAEFAELGFHF